MEVKYLVTAREMTQAGCTAMVLLLLHMGVWDSQYSQSHSLVGTPSLRLRDISQRTNSWRVMAGHYSSLLAQSPHLSDFLLSSLSLLLPVGLLGSWGLQGPQTPGTCGRMLLDESVSQWYMIEIPCEGFLRENWVLSRSLCESEVFWRSELHLYEFSPHLSEPRRRRQQ